MQDQSHTLAARPAARIARGWAWLSIGLGLAGLAMSGLRRRQRAREALYVREIAALAGLTALGVVCARAAVRQQRELDRSVADYSDRRGLPLPPDEMRGMACEDFRAPADMRAPAALQPYA